MNRCSPDSAELTVRRAQFRAQIIEQPAAPETAAHWKKLQENLPRESQGQILLAWNKHLTGVATKEELRHAIDEVMSELQA